MSLGTQLGLVTCTIIPVGRGPQGVRTLCTVLRTLSDLWGGVNGHGVNLRGKCGVCDDVTV